MTSIAMQLRCPSGVHTYMAASFLEDATKIGSESKTRGELDCRKMVTAENGSIMVILTKKVSASSLRSAFGRPSCVNVATQCADSSALCRGAKGEMHWHQTTLDHRP